MVVLITEVAWNTGEILLVEVKKLFFRVWSDRRCAFALQKGVALGW